MPVSEIVTLLISPLSGNKPFPVLLVIWPKPSPAFGNKPPVVVLAFGSATINLGIRSLNYVEELIPELRPHQRVIDTWCNTMYLNPTSPAGKPLPVTDMVVLIPAVVNKHAVISLVTEDVVQEFIITSER